LFLQKCNREKEPDRLFSFACFSRLSILVLPEEMLRTYFVATHYRRFFPSAERRHLKEEIKILKIKNAQIEKNGKTGALRDDESDKIYTSSL
jgi:hypothetical protein